ncbi:MAG: pyridoxamine 5'-phosphate oxidase [Vicinamibacterales bacterium]
MRRATQSQRRAAEAPESVANDPFGLFRKWFREAAKAGEPLPEAMALATTARDGRPSVRVVLNRGVSDGGFVFYTNYHSRKAVEIAGNPRAAAVFHWPRLERQVRVEGRVRKLTRRESEHYFQTRPRESRFSAWASPQSATIPGRSFLEEEFTRVQARFGHGRIPCPPFWGGFRIVADCIEFWQGQPHRLHDRALYRRKGKIWTILRLAP